MKPTLNQLINLAVMLAIVFFIGRAWFIERQVRITAENNYAAEVAYNDREVNLTKKQAKEFWGGVLTKVAEKSGTKTKYITRFIQGDIQYRDTGSVAVVYRPGDTVLVYPDSITGLIQKPCYDLNLLLYKGKFYESIDYHDSLSMALYKGKRTKRVLFIRYGKRPIHGVIYSHCTDSVYKVFNNLNINH